MDNTDIALADALTALGFAFDRTEQEAEWVAAVDGQKTQGKDIWVFPSKTNLEIHVAWKDRRRGVGSSDGSDWRCRGVGGHQRYGSTR